MILTFNMRSNIRNFFKYEWLASNKFWRQCRIRFWSPLDRFSRVPQIFIFPKFLQDFSAIFLQNYSKFLHNISLVLPKIILKTSESFFQNVLLKVCEKYFLHFLKLFLMLDLDILSVSCEWDEVHANVDSHTLVLELRDKVDRCNLGKVTRQSRAYQIN